MVGEDRVELSPRVPKTRMLALHHSQNCCWRFKARERSVKNRTRQPFTQTTCLISATTSTKSSWFFITASIDL